VRPTTILLVSVAFVAGIALGGHGPIAEATAGLGEIFQAHRTHAQVVDHVTAAVSLYPSRIQPSEVTWKPSPMDLASKAACMGKDLNAKHGTLVLQHL
jgi:hypothetical protein